MDKKEMKYSGYTTIRLVLNFIIEIQKKNEL